LGTEFYDVQVFNNGRPSAGLAIRHGARRQRARYGGCRQSQMAELSEFFPAGMKVVYPYDTTPFVKVAINEVVKTLFEAVLLVFLVMWLFMGNLRATLIPTIAVPVVLLGTFAVLGAVRIFDQHADHVLPWFWPSGCWWTMPSWWWKTSSGS
jgi:HAE1 family hydrophobic/amphiphilic exporter-1